MKKLFLFLAAIWCAVGSMQAYTVTRVDTVMEVVRAIHNIELNGDILSFDDSYREYMDSCTTDVYDVLLYDRNENTHLYRYSDSYRSGFLWVDKHIINAYIYGTKAVAESFKEYNASDSERDRIGDYVASQMYFRTSSANHQSFSIENTLSLALARGMRNCRIVIIPCYFWANNIYNVQKNEVFHYICNNLDYEAHHHYWGIYNNNYLDTTLPYAIVGLNVDPNLALNPATNEGDAYVYGQNFRMQYRVQAADEVRYIVMYRKGESQPWASLLSHDLSIKNAREGGDWKDLNYTNQMSNTKQVQFCLAAVNLTTPKEQRTAADTIWSAPTPMREIYYPIYVDGKLKYIDPMGEKVPLISLGIDTRTQNVSIECRQTVTIQNDGIPYFELPGYPVYVTTSERKYTVRFVGIEGQLLKEEQVSYQGAAHAPTPPQVEGCNFIKWDKDFSIVKKDMTVHAIYDPFVSFGTFTLEVANHTFANTDADMLDLNPMEYITPGDEFQLHLHVQSQSSMTVRLQVKYNGGNWDDAEFVSLTAAQAQAGYDVTKNVSILSTDWFTHERAYRYRLSSAGTTVYTNAITMKMLYPLTVQANVETAVRNGDYPGYVLQPGQSKTFLVPYDGEICATPNNDGGHTLECMDIQTIRTTLNEGNSEERNGLFYIDCPGYPETFTMDIKKYKVVYQVIGAPSIVSWMHNVVAIDTVDCGSPSTIDLIVSDPLDPRARFDGWDENLDEVMDDIYTIAQFTQYEELPTYKVVFKDFGGNTLSEQVVREGDNAVPPAEVPYLEGYHFVGWIGGSPYCVEENLTLVTRYITEEEYQQMMEELTDIPAATVAEPSATKTIENGQVVIIRGGKKFNLMGAEL